jgi:hypothetical protein
MSYAVMTAESFLFLTGHPLLGAVSLACGAGMWIIDTFIDDDDDDE